MSIELSRRDFIKVVFASTTVAAVSGAATMWPSNTLARPVCDPVLLKVVDGYIIDPGFDYCEICPPTNRVHLSLDGVEDSSLKMELDKIFWEIEHLVEDPGNWSISEVEEWLDSYVELDALGAWEAMKYTQYGPALEIYQQMNRDDAEDLGLMLVEGSHPGSNFVGIAFHGDPKELSNSFQRLGMNLIVTSG